MNIHLPYVSWDGSAHTRDPNTFIDEMTKHYLICALWSSGDDATEHFDSKYSIDDIAPETLENATFDCTAFLKLARWHVRDWSPEQLGHDFWLTRCGHGAGFWDRTFGTKESRDQLTKLSEVFGNVDPCVGDDGKVWIQ